MLAKHAILGIASDPEIMPARETCLNGNRTLTPQIIQAFISGYASHTHGNTPVQLKNGDVAET